MIITIKTKDVETQKPIVTIDTETCHYPHSIRKALELALQLDGYTEETINNVFNRESDQACVSEERFVSLATEAALISDPQNLNARAYSL
jgi:hypothetical protein